MRSIGGVVAALDEIIAWERAAGSRRGYFPCMYRATTLRVADGLSKGRFRDPERMERLDVLFAEYYLQAWRQRRGGLRCSGPWALAFRSAERADLLILQHLLLGMNAHINLDLAQATVEVLREGDGEAELADLRADFDTINDILGEQLDQVQDRLNAHSPALDRLDRAGGRWDERLFHFSLVRARDLAWGQSRKVAALPPPERQAACRGIERTATGLGEVLVGVRATGAREAEPDRDERGVRGVIDSLWLMG